MHKKRICVLVCALVLLFKCKFKIIIIIKLLESSNEINDLEFIIFNFS